MLIFFVFIVIVEKTREQVPNKESYFANGLKVIKIELSIQSL